MRCYTPLSSFETEARFTAAPFVFMRQSSIAESGRILIERNFYSYPANFLGNCSAAIQPESCRLPSSGLRKNIQIDAVQSLQRFVLLEARICEAIVRCRIR